MDNVKKKHEQIIRYYNDCEIDYKLLWRLNKCHNMHYGYFNKGDFSLRKAIMRMNDQILKYIDPKKELYVLDAGCGYGGTSIYLAGKTKSKFEGITIVDKQVQKGSKIVKSYGLQDRVRITKQDYMRTKFKDGTFDVVFGIESVCHADKEKFLKEAFRILKPGGLLIVLDGFNAKEKYSEKEYEIMRKQNSGWVVDSLETPAYFVDTCREIGFVDIKYRNITKKVEKTSLIMYVAHFPAVVVDTAGRILGIRTKYNTGNVRAAKYQYIGMKRGLWEYGEFCAKKK